MFEDFIKVLLEADAKIDAEYALNKAKVKEMLTSCGYVENTETEEVETVEAENGEINY